MHDLPPPWQPRVGERVGIRGSRLRGIVERIEGQGTGARFTLKVVAPPDDDAGAVYELTQAASAARTVYTLGDLTPSSAQGATRVRLERSGRASRA
jgi:hypothetical protein